MVAGPVKAVYQSEEAVLGRSLHSMAPPGATTASFWALLDVFMCLWRPSDRLVAFMKLRGNQNMKKTGHTRKKPFFSRK